MRDDSRGALRSFAILGAVIALWWVIPGAVRRVARESFCEFSAPLFIAESRLKDIRSYWDYASRPQDRTDRGLDATFARMNADMAVRLAQTEELARENKRLEEALGVPSRPRIRQVVARVAQRDINRWWSRVVLAKGTSQGVRDGCSVVNGGGVVGRVVAAHRNTCEVQLVTDPEFRISANLEGEDAPVVFHGATTEAFAAPTGLVTQVRGDFKNEIMPAAARRHLRTRRRVPRRPLHRHAGD